MNREVMNRQMFAQGGFVRPMQEGGIASMQLMPQAAPAPDPAMMGGMPPDPAMMGGMPPEEMSMDQAAQGAMAQGVDPAMLEQTLGDYQQGMNDLDNAEDYETVINTIRGDQLPMQARYDELAGMVGPEDATATPESVLTLIQPVMQMAAVDQGIGGLAQDEMMAPIEGPMAEGIMSTVNMGPAEGPAPVNFSQGGAVQYMNNGGPVRYMDNGGPAGQITPNYKLGELPLTLDNAISGDSKELTRMKQLYQNQKYLQDSLLGAGNNEAAFEEQKNLTQAQMLFDVAQGALAFASPGDRQMSPAERLAQSFSPVLGNIGIRAGELGKFKQTQEAEDRARDLAALSTSQGLYSTELAAQVAADAQIKADAAAVAAAAQELKNDQAAAKLKADAVLLNGGDPLTVTYGNPDGDMFTSTRIYNVGELNAMKKSNKFVKQEKPGSNTLLTQLYDVTTVVKGVKTTKKGQLLTPDQYATYQQDGNVVLKKSVETTPEFKQVYYPPVDGITPASEMLQVGTAAHAKAIRSKDKGGDGGLYNPATADSYTTIPTELLEPQTIDGVVYLKGKVLNLNKTQRADLAPDVWQDTKDAKDVKAPDYITFVNFKNRDEFVLIDKNDSSAANKQVLSDIVSAVDEQGNNIYRIEGNLTASTSSGTVAADIVNFVPPAGSNLEPAMIDISTETGIARARKLGQLGYLKGGAASSDGSKATPNVKVFIDRDDPSQRKELDLNDPEQYKEFQALGKNWSMTTVPSMADLATGPNLGKGENAKLMQLLSNQDIMGAYSTNTLDPSTAELINGYLTNRMRLTPVFDETRQEHVMVPGLKVTQTVLDAIAARGKIGGASMPTIGAQGLDLNADPTDNTTGRIKFNDDNTIDFSTFENDPVLLITGIDLTKAQGFGSSVNRFFNFVVGQWGELPFGEKGSYAGEGGKITAKGTTQLNALARRVVSTARSGVEGKLFKYDMDLLKQEVDGFTPSGMNTDNGARDQLLVVRQNLASLYLLANGVATNPGIQKDIDKAVRLREQFEQLIAETTAAIGVYDKYLGSDPIGDIKSDQQKLTSTSSLTRASAAAPTIE